MMHHLALLVLCVISELHINAMIGNPVIAFESVVRDFGKVDKGIVLKHIFNFINKGDSALEILDVKPG